MAMTTKQEIKITRFDDAGNPIYKEGRGRKEFLLHLKSRHYSSAPEEFFSGAVFEGHNQPVTCDTDGGRCFRGNALYNFVGEPEKIKQWIEAGQINPHFEPWLVVAVKNDSHDGDECLVFPDLYRGGHAVIDRLLTKV